MQQLSKKHYSLDEYFVLEEKRAFRSEYYQGEIFAMAGASIDHNRIVRNLSNKLDSALRRKNDCEVFQLDLRLWVEPATLIAYPDILVICGEPEFYENRRDTVTNPKLVIEVLSKTTKSYDQNNKFRFYRMLPTFEEYILIDQYRPHIEAIYKDGDRWIMTEFASLKDTLKFATIDFQISLSEIYDRVRLDD